MALYSISDLHLPLGIHKPMDIFGKAWENYVDRLAENWQAVVKAEDTVVLPGDFSWATYLEESLADFEYLEQLPGKKILLKGNHDYWWGTISKMRAFLQEQHILSVDFLHNNSFLYEDIGICGTRGWVFGDSTSQEDQKIFAREIIRLELSLQDVMKQNPREIYVFTHYPPLAKTCVQTGVTELMKRYPVSKCIYGHLHAAAHQYAVEGWVDGIEYLLAAGDYQAFAPVLLHE